MSSSNLSNKHLVAVALFQLGGGEHAINTEDLAVKVAELAPGRFRWKKYPDQIDLEAVRLSVKNSLRGDTPFVTGSMRYGWMLTPAGFDWCIRSAAQDRTTNSQVTEGLALLRQTDSYKKLQQGQRDEITIHDLRRFLRVDEYTSTRRRKERVQAVINTVSGDQQLTALIVYFQQQFPEEWK